MRKSIRTFAVAVLATVALPLSSAVAQGAFTPGTKMLSVGMLSDGGTGVAGSFEYGVLEFAPNITLGIGGTVGYFSQDAGIFGDFTSMPILANGNVHLALPDVPQLDLYGGLAVGIIRYSYDDNFSGVGADFSDSDTVVGFNVGGRWMFTPKFGAFAQLGLGDVPELYIGGSLKF